MKYLIYILSFLFVIHTYAQEHYAYIVGSKQYELSNHLGNILATISDKKLYETNSNGVLEIRAETLTANDYYPFGMLMDERSFELPNTDYKYGFNGKESDDELSGDGNQYDYGFRIYNPRIAKFLSVDPLTKSYPMLTPYQFASNMPINSIDLDGLEASETITTTSPPVPTLTLTTYKSLQYTSDNVPPIQIAAMSPKESGEYYTQRSKNTRTYYYWVDFPSTDRSNKPGMYVSVTKFSKTSAPSTSSVESMYYQGSTTKLLWGSIDIKAAQDFADRPTDNYKYRPKASQAADFKGYVQDKLAENIGPHMNAILNPKLTLTFNTNDKEAMQDFERFYKKHMLEDMKIEDSQVDETQGPFIKYIITWDNYIKPMKVVYDKGDGYRPIRKQNNGTGGTTTTIIPVVAQ